MKIRTAKLEDKPDIVEMYISLYDVLNEKGLMFRLDKDKIESLVDLWISSKFYSIFVAEDKNELMGFVCMSYHKIENKMTYEHGEFIAKVSEIFVKDTCRGKGVATNLLYEGEKWVKNLGINIIEYGLVSGNYMADAFSKKNGYNDHSLSRIKILCGI